MPIWYGQPTGACGTYYSPTTATAATWTTNSTATTIPPSYWWTGTGNTTSATAYTTITTSSTASTTSNVIWYPDQRIWINQAPYVPHVEPQPFVPAAPAIVYRPSRINREEIRLQQAAAARRAEQQRGLENLRRIEQRRPIERAQGLLMRHLTAEQRTSIERNGWFMVVGSSGKRYRIRAANNNFAGNVDAMDGDKVMHRLCAHMAYNIPFGDQILAQKLMLENAEEDFLKIANRHAA